MNEEEPEFEEDYEGDYGDSEGYEGDTDEILTQEEISENDSFEDIMYKILRKKVPKAFEDYVSLENTFK